MHPAARERKPRQNRALLQNPLQNDVISMSWTQTLLQLLHKVILIIPWYHEGDRVPGAEISHPMG